MPRRTQPDDLSDFGRAVEDWRREHGLSQAIVAKLIGTSQRSLSGWIRKGGIPGGVFQIARLAALMDLSMDNLIEDDANVAPLRDMDFVERTLLRLASPDVVARYLKCRAQEKLAQKHAGGNA